MASPAPAGAGDPAPLLASPASLPFVLGEALFRLDGVLLDGCRLVGGYVLFADNRTSPVAFAQDRDDVALFKSLGAARALGFVPVLVPATEASPHVVTKVVPSRSSAAWGLGIFHDLSFPFSAVNLAEISWNDLVPRLLSELAKPALLCRVAVKHNRYIDIPNSQTFCSDLFEGPRGFAPMFPDSGEPAMFILMQKMTWHSTFEFVVDVMLSGTRWMMKRIEAWQELHPAEAIGESFKFRMMINFHDFLASMENFHNIHIDDGFAPLNDIDKGSLIDEMFRCMCVAINTFLHHLLDLDNGEEPISIF